MAMTGPPVKAVFFDIGNVLLRFDPQEVLAKIAGALGRSPHRIARYLWTSLNIEALERGEFGTDDLYSLFQDKLDYKGDFAQFKKLWCDHFTLQRRTAALLKQVSRRIPTYLLSNTNALHYDFIRKRYAFTRHVHGMVLSHEVGMRKPEPRIFRAALRLAKVARPAQAVFIDDLELNVRAARKAGLKAILYRGPADLRRRLEGFGVLG